MDAFDDGEFFVVVNDEEQHSIWPSGLDVPAGWTTVGDPGPRATCLATIERCWTDIRPRSLRVALESAEGTA
jgi:MbtH protein